MTIHLLLCFCATLLYSNELELTAENSDLAHMLAERYQTRVGPGLSCECSKSLHPAAAARIVVTGRHATYEAFALVMYHFALTHDSPDVLDVLRSVANINGIC